MQHEIPWNPPPSGGGGCQIQLETQARLSADVAKWTEKWRVAVTDAATVKREYSLMVQEVSDYAEYLEGRRTPKKRVVKHLRAIVRTHETKLEECSILIERRCD